MRIASGTTDQYVYFVGLLAGERVTGLATWTVYRSRNGAAAAAMTTPTINETDVTNMPGVYELLLDEDMTIGAGNETEAMVFHITEADMDPVTIQIELYRPKITAGNTLGVESDGDLTKVNTLNGHTAQTGDNYARLGAPAGASVSADVAAVKTETALIVLDTNELQTDWVDAGRLDTILDIIAADVVNLDGAAMRGTDGANTDKTGFSLSGTGVDDILDEAYEGTTTMRQFLRLAAGVLFGKSDSHESGTPNYRNEADTLNRIAASTDANGNRTAITLNKT